MLTHVDLDEVSEEINSLLLQAALPSISDKLQVVPSSGYTVRYHVKWTTRSGWTVKDYQNGYFEISKKEKRKL